MLGIDDGLWSGNLNAADIFFLLATILAVVAALLAAAATHPVSRFYPVAGWIAVAFLAFGWLIL